jgi:hypothetical protein
LEFYKDIDNGGIKISLVRNSKFNCKLTVSTQYLGYPWVETVLNFGYSATGILALSAENLREIGNMFSKFADSLEQDDVEWDF